MDTNRINLLEQEIERLKEENQNMSRRLEAMSASPQLPSPGILEGVIDNVNDCIVAVSISQAKVVYCNKQFIKEYDVDPDEVRTRCVYEYPASFSTREGFDVLVQKVRAAGGRLTYRASYDVSDDHTLHVNQVSAYIDNGRDDDIIWFFMQDVTELVNSRDEQYEMNHLLDTVLNNMPIYVFVKDVGDNFRYLYWNKAFADYSSIPASKVIGRTDFEVFPERGDAEKFRRDDLEVVETNAPIDRHETYVTAKGDTRIVKTIKTLVYRVGRSPLLIGISWDITYMQNIEQELIQERIRAEQSDRLKTAFLANMSHEIRTPLNAIVGFSQLLTEEDATPEESKMYSNVIRQNSEVLLQLINDILDLAKIEAGTLEYVRNPMNLGDILRNVYQAHKNRVHDNVTLVLDNADASIMINEDRNRITQVVTNLITNAIKFTTRGEIRFGYQLKEGFVEVYVKDTGMGISKDKTDKIFDRFVKLNTFVQGTGLGLPICKMIVDKFGGQMSVQSEPGKGSVFSFTIPYKSPVAPGAPSASPAGQSAGAAGAAAAEPSKKVILVAEDIESNFALVKAMIGKKYILLRAYNGDEAVKMFKKHSPDLILMDIKMPKIDGLEATRFIRAYSRAIPIIALTANAFDYDKDRALEAGCNDYITKPVSKPVLEKTLQRYI